MLNLKRTGNLVCRANSKIIYSYTEIWKKSFSRNSGNGNEKDVEDDDNIITSKSSIHEKPSVLKKKKSNHLNNRDKQALIALQELLSNTQQTSTDGENSEEIQKIASEDSGSAYKSGAMHDFLNYADVKPYTKKIEITTAEPKLSKPSSSKTLLDTIKAAAAELGGDIEATEKELLVAYESIKGVQRKPFPKTPLATFTVESDKEYDLETPKYKHNIRRLSSCGKLNIFTENVKDQPEQSVLKMWHRLHASSLIDSSVHAPKNYFDQLIHWTRQGKLWHFPIDNEQGMELEQNTDFSEHIFLDKYLEPWCPKSGPLRHFMELVTVGLSKNPYITVQQKKEHIMWYKEYFDGKKKLLNELGVLESVTTEKIEST